MKMLFKMECYKCRSTEVVKNGIVRGKQRYLCKSCKRNFSEKKEILKNHLKRLAIHLYLEGMTRGEIGMYLSELKDEKFVKNWIDKLDKNTRSCKKEKSPQIIEFREFKEIEELILRTKPTLREGFILIGFDDYHQVSFFIKPTPIKDSLKNCM